MRIDVFGARRLRKIALDRFRAFGRLSGIMGDSGSRRLLVLSVILIVIIVIGLLATLCTFLIVLARVSLSDRLAEIADVMSGATLLLTVVAALVALFAYAVATGLPELKVRVGFEFSNPNSPSFTGHLAENGDIRADEFKQLMMTVSISNEGNYSARNPAVNIRLRGMAFLGEPKHIQQGGWAVIGFVTTQGITEIQWDGGGDYSIHGQSVRKLPTVWLSKLRKVARWPAPCIEVRLLADGYRKDVRIPVDFTVDGQSMFASNINEVRVSDWI